MVRLSSLLVNNSVGFVTPNQPRASFAVNSLPFNSCECTLMVDYVIIKKYHMGAKPIKTLVGIGKWLNLLGMPYNMEHLPRVFAGDRQNY